MGVWSRLTSRPSSSIRALVFFVLGEVTPSWSSFTRGSADDCFRLTMSLCPVLGLGLEMGLGPGLGLVLEDSLSDGILSLGLGLDDDNGDKDDNEGLGVSEAPGLPVASLESGLGMRPEPRLGLEPLWWSEEGLVLGVEVEAGLGVEVALGFVAVDDVAMLGLDIGLLVVGLTPLLFSFSLRWLLYELRLGSL